MAIFDQKTHLDYRRRLVCHGRHLEVGLGRDGSRHAEGGAHEEALILDPDTWNCHHLGFMISISEAEEMLREGEGICVSAARLYFMEFEKSGFMECQAVNIITVKSCRGGWNILADINASWACQMSNTNFLPTSTQIYYPETEWGL